ncbi:hypothetical protein M422DRAFT_33947 [Sphaerobolus stellatus SS14]|uniref:F-box domain-containing protein n=1 Tax=Sphaerobolus stellatus (strain SS14) TaxID=990650 RepID=A0A0C9V671_SPHS4|nr:hypothetical protein M422DRAFT_33947 [Sphaerobolus stellatus SS14]
MAQLERWSDDYYSGLQYPLIAPNWPTQVPKKNKCHLTNPGIPLVPNESTVIESWIYEQRPRPKFQDLPDEVHERIAAFCLNPHQLLALSSTCTRLANLLRSVECWLDHHWGNGYDIGILRRKAKWAASSPEQKYGASGWGLLVQSARDKWEFQDFSFKYQFENKKHLPHDSLEREWKDNGKEGENPIDTYQKRGEYCIDVMLDVISEHECRNFLLHRYLYEDALGLILRNGKYKCMQALIAATHLLNGQWQVFHGIYTNDMSVLYARERMEDLTLYSTVTKTNGGTLGFSLLCAVQLMQVDEFLDSRRMYPHPPLGPNMWLDLTGGGIDPKKYDWAVKARDDWQGRVDAVANFCSMRMIPACNIERGKIGRGVAKMRLEIDPEGNIEGRGADFGGKFTIVGRRDKNTVSLRKEYLHTEDEDHDVYTAIGQILPWGIFGHWSRHRDDDPEEIELEDGNEDSRKYKLGFFGLWKFEGAPKIWLPFREEVGEDVYEFIPKPYTVNTNWFDKFEDDINNNINTDRLWAFHTDELPGFSDVETEYEDDEIDEQGNAKRGKRRPKYKVVAFD